MPRVVEDSRIVAAIAKGDAHRGAFRSGIGGHRNDASHSCQVDGTYASTSRGMKLTSTRISGHRCYLRQGAESGRLIGLVWFGFVQSHGSGARMRKHKLEQETTQGAHALM